MAEIHGRFINTAIWRDDWFLSLRESEQHLFLYLLSCPPSSLTGIYQLGLMEAAFHTKIDQQEIKRIFVERFQPDKKAFFEVGWVVMINWLKHQRFNTNMWTRAASDLNGLPIWLRQKIFNPRGDMFIDVKKVSNGSLTIENDSEGFPNVSIALDEKKRKEDKGKEKKRKQNNAPPPLGGKARPADAGQDTLDLKNSEGRGGSKRYPGSVKPWEEEK